MMFDYSILYLIGFGLLAIAMGFGLSFLMKKYNIKTEDVINGVNLTQTIITLVKSMATDLGYGNQEEIEKVTEIISDSLNYVKGLPQLTNKDEKINHAYSYVRELCETTKIELTEDRQVIIVTILTIVFNLIEAIEKR